jgi:hypothetical protein
MLVTRWRPHEGDDEMITSQKIVDYQIETAFESGAKLSWNLYARSMAEAQAKAWDTVAKLLHDGAAEGVIGDEVQDMVVRPVRELARPTAWTPQAEA